MSQSITGEWTKMRTKETIGYSLNAVKTHVTISSTSGSFTISVVELRNRLCGNNLLPDVRKMYRAMLDYYEANKNV